MILLSMARPSVVVARARLLDIRLDEIAVLRDVARTGCQACEHFDARCVGAAELQHAHLVRVTDLLEDDIEVAEALQPRPVHGERYLRFTHRDASRDELAGTQYARRVVENDARPHALAAMNR